MLRIKLFISQVKRLKINNHKLYKDASIGLSHFKTYELNFLRKLLDERIRFYYVLSLF
jgi:hypothetical protein